MSSSLTNGAVATREVTVVMPQMGVSVAEGTLLEWHVRPGDQVVADQTIADVSTDKVDVEIPSPAAGRLVRILIGPGETVPVGTPLAEIDTGGGAQDAGEINGRTDDAEAEPHHAEPEADRSRFYSPVVRRIAEEHQIDLEAVDGHGVGGRVRKDDLLAYIRAGQDAPAPRPAERSQPVLHSESPYRPDEPVEMAPATPPRARVEGHREPMSPMRLAIARHMLESRRTSAHCTTIVEVDFSRVAARREELAAAMDRRGVKLTPLAFVAAATVGALQDYPRLNASVEGEEIVHHDDVNLGIAVALDDGLIVPVIKRAQRLSAEGLAAAIGDLATRARERKLDPDEVHGGTFTITNPGQFGSVLATPIINQPQVAILDVEAIVKRVVVVEEGAGEQIAIRPVGHLCMSWDHRALDGVDAARFLGSVKARLESEVSR